MENRNPELDQAMKALVNADQVGNIEDCKKLAVIVDRLSKLEPEQPKTEGAMPFVNKGIATTFGAPVDLVNAVLDQVGLGSKQPFGGSKSIETGMQKAGIVLPTRPPQYPAEYMGQGIGETIGAILPATKGAQILSKSAGAFGNIAKGITESLIQNPKTALLSEITGGAGMGLGREATEGKPSLRPYGELIGGLLGGTLPTALTYAPTALAFKGAKSIAKKVSMPFTEKGATYRAGDYLQKLVANPENVSELITTPTIGKLPPVVATGEKRLVALYNQFRNLDPKVDAQAIDDIGKSIYKLEQEMRGMGYGSPDILKDVTQKRIDALNLKMDTRIKNSMQIAQNKLNEIPVAKRKGYESTVVRDELTKAMQNEKVLVDEQWAQVPKNVIVKTGNLKNIYRTILDDLAIAQQGDIPLILRNSPLIKEGVELISVKEMQGLRSKLLEVSRQARANNQWNRARISNDVADAILEDMGASIKGAITPGGEKLRTALDMTRSFKNKYETGIVGKILGYEKTSAPSLAPELTLDASIGRMGEKGAIDINKILVSPESRKATERYLTRSFADDVLDKNNMINLVRAEKWIKNNEAILDNFPELKVQLSDASQAQKLANNTKGIMDLRKQKLQDPRISQASQFLKTDIGNEINTIFKSKNPTSMTRQLIKQANKDETGNSLEGLKGGFVDYFLDKSSIGKFNSIGEKTLSGSTLNGLINKNIDVLREVFPQEQIMRMKKIADELSKIEVVENTKGMNVQYDDITQNIIRTLSRVGGAAAGRHWGKAMGAGGTVQIPGIFASNWQKIATFFTKNRFERLIHDAITSPDGELFNSLMLPVNKPKTASTNWKVFNKKLNAWMVGIGNNVLQDYNEENKENQ